MSNRSTGCGTEITLGVKCGETAVCCVCEANSEAVVQTVSELEQKLMDAEARARSERSYIERTTLQRCAGELQHLLAPMSLGNATWKEARRACTDRLEALEKDNAKLSNELAHARMSK